MNGPHLHLAVNHLPVVGALFACLLLLFALLRGRDALRRAALLGLVVVGVLALPAYFSGEPAEEAIENRPGFEEARVEQHEDLAKAALIAVELAALVGLVGLLVFRRRPVPAAMVLVALVVSVVSVALMARTATLGGEISHPEIRGGTAVTPGGDEAGESHGGG